MHVFNVQCIYERQERPQQTRGPGALAVTIRVRYPSHTEAAEKGKKKTPEYAKEKRDAIMLVIFFVIRCVSRAWVHAGRFFRLGAWVWVC